MATVESSPTIQQNQPPPSQNLEQNQPPVQTQLPIQTPIVDLPSSPSKAFKRGKPTKKKAKAAMVDLASSPSKQDNEGEIVAAMVDLVSSPSKGATSVRYTRAKIRSQKNVMIVPPESEPVRNEVRVLFNDKVLKKCKFTLCWIHALTFFCLKITYEITLCTPCLKITYEQWVVAHFLYQPTAHDEVVLADLKKKWSFATRRATRRRL